MKKENARINLLVSSFYPASCKVRIMRFKLDY